MMQYFLEKQIDMHQESMPMRLIVTHVCFSANHDRRGAFFRVLLHIIMPMHVAYHSSFVLYSFKEKHEIIYSIIECIHSVNFGFTQRM